MCKKEYKFTHIFTATFHQSNSAYKIHSYITSRYNVGIKLFKYKKSVLRLKNKNN